MNILKLHIMDLVSGTSTNIEGYTLYVELSNHFEKGFVVELSMKDLTPFSTSFLNSSFGELVDKFGFDFIKKHLILTDYRISDAKKIQEYLLDVIA